MDIKIFLISLVLIIAGIVIIAKNKFYKRSTNTMLFPAEVKLFLAGLLLTLIGIIGFINEILKLNK